MEFQYQPLKPNEIRLLNPISWLSDPFCFEIIHRPLSSKPSYVALSYTWGLKGNTHDITLNGSRLPVRKNLHDALRQIQSSKHVEKFLWVDAICINQAGDVAAKAECSVQVLLMRQIYEQADKVLVWLGAPENIINNRLAFPLMKEFATRFYAVMKKGRPYRPWWYQTQMRTFQDDVADFMLTISPAQDKSVFDVPGSKTYKAWLGIVAVWKNPWWTRTWIFQEATIPEPYIIRTRSSSKNFKQLSSKVKLICGDQEATWFDFNVTSMVASNIITTPGLDSQFIVGTNNLPEKLAKFRDLRICETPWSFLDVLEMFRHTNCWDPRDKIYAPLCLAPDDVHRHIKPDYGIKTALDVYSEVVRYCLLQPGYTLDFLGHAIFREHEPVVEIPASNNSDTAAFISVLPSWVPNYSVGIELTPIPKLLYAPREWGKKGLKFTDKRGLPDNKEEKVPAFCPLDNALSRPFTDGRQLGVGGVFVDIVWEVIPDDGPDLEVARARGREIGNRWATAMKSNYFTGESYKDAFQRTRALDLVYDDHGRPAERGGRIDHAFLAKPRAQLTLVEYRYQLNMRLAKVRSQTSRRMGISRNLYLMTVPGPAVAGDELWALAGGQALYILRPIGSERLHFRFIGECHAHGLMDGEIMRRMHLGELMMKNIYLV